MTGRAETPSSAGSIDPGRAAEVLRERLPWEPEVLVVLGSGLGPLADRVEAQARVEFRELPGFPDTGVVGHAGRYVAAEISGRRTLLQQGRFHVYEGHDSDVIALPVRTARALGVRSMIVTNAAGGIRRDLTPGSLVLIDDHINLQGRSTLIGPVHGDEQRFPDLTEAWDVELRALARGAAERLSLELPSGVYVALTGPTYETPAEIRMLERLGGDMVGMSTVPEVHVARAGGVRCLGFSLITNPAAGLSGEPLNHDEVMQVAGEAGERLERLVRAVLEEWPVAAGSES
jgi:purine-nucleoside phosphorylase